MRNKLLESLHEEDRILAETEVFARDGFVYVKGVRGTERWVPKDFTADEVIAKFNGIRKHSEGRAWQWLKGLDKEGDVEKLEECDVPTYAEQGECPYSDAVAKLSNSEVEAVEEYDSAILLFNDSDVPNKQEIIAKLQHIKEEELEHMEELKLIKAMFTGEEIPKEDEDHSEEEAHTEEKPVEEPTVEPETEPETEEDYDVVEESLEEDNEVYKLFKGKSFKSYEEIEKFCTDAGFEVVDVFREGNGFNINLKKETAEYFVPVEECSGEYFPSLDSATMVVKSVNEAVLDEAGFFTKIGDAINKMMAKAANKGNALNGLDAVGQTLAKAYPEYNVKIDSHGLKLTPKVGFVASIEWDIKDDGTVDVKAVTNAEGAVKSVASMEDALEILKKGLGIHADETVTPPAVETTPEEDDEDVKNAVATLKAKGFTLDQIKDKLGL